MGNSFEEHGHFILPIFDYRRVMMIEQWIWGGNYISYNYYTFWTRQITGALKIIELRCYTCKVWHKLCILFWRTSSGQARTRTNGVGQPSTNNTLLMCSCGWCLTCAKNRRISCVSFFGTMGKWMQVEVCGMGFGTLVSECNRRWRWGERERLLLHHSIP